MARTLTVVQVLPRLEGGGVERGTLEVAGELVRRGHRSFVISGGGRLVPKLEAAGSRHLEWPIGAKSPSTLRFVSRLRTFLRNEPADIVHARSRLPAWITEAALRRLPDTIRPHFVTTIHGLYSVNRYSAVMTRGERIIAVSQTARDYLIKNYPAVDPARIRVVQRGVDAQEFPYRHRPSLGWLERWRNTHPELNDKLVITLPGRVGKRKGHDAFLNVVADLAASGLPVWGVIAGGAAKRSHATKLKRQVRKRGLPVSFAGHREDIRDVYAVSNLVVSMSSKPESFGRTVLEALSLGIPVIGYAEGGVGEVLSSVFPEGRVTAGDVEAFSDKARDFLTRARIVPEFDAFSLDAMLDKTIAVYEELAR